MLLFRLYYLRLSPRRRYLDLLILNISLNCLYYLIWLIYILIVTWNKILSIIWLNTTDRGQYLLRLFLINLNLLLILVDVINLWNHNRVLRHRLRLLNSRLRFKFIFLINMVILKSRFFILYYASINIIYHHSCLLNRDRYLRL